MTPLTSILEIKRTLAGEEKRFDCLRLAGNADHVVVLWIARAPMHVHGVDLPAGTVSFGHFWTGRFYNVYHWVDADRRTTIGFYFNLADQTRIAASEIVWRDLVVDVLATPDGRVEVLDEDELPEPLDTEVAAHISDGKTAILGEPARVMTEIETASRALYPLVFPEPG
jgi:predicted RNA-binding protein associated with RNAse of E/G family